MNACKKCGATSALIVGFSSALCRSCHAAARARHQAINGNALSTDYEVRIYASPSLALAQVVEICIYAMDDAGAQWRLTWRRTSGDLGELPAVVEGAWETIRAWVTQRLRAEGLAHLQPVRHRGDDAEAHDASAAAVVLLRRGATAAQLRRLARYAGPTAQREGF